MTLIYDRTQADVDNARSIIERYKKSGWENLTDADRARLERGTYTYNTINRVNDAVEEFAGIYNGLDDVLGQFAEENNVDRASWNRVPYDYPIYPVIVEYNAQGYFTESSLQTYLGNISAFREGLNDIVIPLPEVPDDFRGYMNANRIEKLIKDMTDALASLEADIKELILIIKVSYYYSGEIYAGEGIGVM